MYLFDTDTVSNLLKRVPSTSLIARIASIPPEQQFTSSITLGELLYGAYRLEERGAALLQRLKELLLPNLQVLAFDVQAARHYGQIRAVLEQKRASIGHADLQIAAIALAHSLTVVTRNVRHFDRVPGLIVENWID